MPQALCFQYVVIWMQCLSICCFVLQCLLICWFVNIVILLLGPKPSQHDSLSYRANKYILCPINNETSSTSKWKPTCGFSVCEQWCQPAVTLNKMVLRTTSTPDVPSASRRWDCRKGDSNRTLALGSHIKRHWWDRRFFDSIRPWALACRANKCMLRCDRCHVTLILLLKWIRTCVLNEHAILTHCNKYCPTFFNKSCLIGKRDPESELLKPCWRDPDLHFLSRVTLQRTPTLLSQAKQHPHNI